MMLCSLHTGYAILYIIRFWTGYSELYTCSLLYVYNFYTYVNTKYLTILASLYWDKNKYIFTLCYQSTKSV